MIKLLIGGSPCTHWSICKRTNRETKPEGVGWELFENYLIAKEKFNPDFFLYENNKSTAQAIKDEIKARLGVNDGEAQYIEINSALVSAQNRERFYVHNGGNIPQPKDRGILLADILEPTATGKGYKLAAPIRPANPTKDGKGRTMKATYQRASPKNFISPNHFPHTGVVEPIERGSLLIAPPPHVYDIKNGLITVQGNVYSIDLPDGRYIIRPLTVKECCRLQTLPDDYCRAVSNAQAYKGLGNGWTAGVIIHLLSYMLKDVPKDEEIIILSMYDGIGTGRYCLDKMGFTNVKYYAFEIDKYAIKIALSNFPDIIQRGDAYQARDKDFL